MKVTVFNKRSFMLHLLFVASDLTWIIKMSIHTSFCCIQAYALNVFLSLIKNEKLGKVYL